MESNNTNGKEIVTIDMHDASTKNDANEANETSGTPDAEQAAPHAESAKAESKQEKQVKLKILYWISSNTFPNDRLCLETLHCVAREHQLVASLLRWDFDFDVKFHVVYPWTWRSFGIRLDSRKMFP